jgi:hypothetical protein
MRFEFLKPTCRHGKAQLYALNYKSPVIQKFKELDKVLCDQVMKKAIAESVPAE